MLYYQKIIRGWFTFLRVRLNQWLFYFYSTVHFNLIFLIRRPTKFETLPKHTPLLKSFLKRGFVGELRKKLLLKQTFKGVIKEEEGVRCTFPLPLVLENEIKKKIKN